MNWFRFYHQALDDPKVQRLDPCLFKAWVNLLCLASRQEPRGTLPALDDIAFALRADPTEAETWLQGLISHRLVDERGGTFHIHDWGQWQRHSDDVTARVTKHRQRKQSDETLHETLPPVDAERFGNVLEQNRNREEREQSRAEQRDGADAPRSRAKPRTAVPDNFTVADDDYAWASSKGFGPEVVDQETEKFVLSYQANGKPMKDWRAAWRTWMLRVPEFARQPRPPPPNGFGPKGPDASYFAAKAKALEAQERERETT